jgi:phosphatidate cytidylyltransferase
MFGARILVTLIGLPIIIAIFMAGGWLFAVVVAAVLARAAWEYAGIFEAGGAQPVKWLMAAGAAAILLVRFFSLEAEWLPALLALLAATLHLFAYERGRNQAATDFTITLSGIVYIGILGSYFAAVRNLPNGEWWLLLTLVAVWLADSAAYLIGTPYGKHKMAPRLSPKKSWEGYVAGVVFSTAGAPLFGLLFARLGMPADAAFSSLNLAILGFVIGALTTLGDLTESMIKRQMKVKDASQLLPGHGGIFDRIDSWLWALPLGYFLITLFFLN